MNQPQLTRCLIAIFPLAACTVARAQTLVWSEEFNGPTIDRDTWTFNTGGSGFGNGELQYYTARPENVFIENGSLVIEARRENYLGDKAFTSGRIITNGRFAFKYGTVEARIQLPHVDNGLWPAFWIMGTNFGAINWPACGEFDIMEFGRKDGFEAGMVNRRIVSAAHWDYQGNHAYYDTYTDRPVDMHLGYHLFRLEWTPTEMRSYVDGDLFWQMDISDPVGDSLEEFHEPMFLLTNVAVGGWNFVEITDPNAISANFPQRMYIDYIRLYDEGDTELYFGSDAEETGDFGIFTETAPVNNSVAYETDASLYLWNNLTSQTGTAFEGSEAWNMRAAGGQWWGMGVLSTQFDRNLSNYDDGHMHLHMKMASNETFKIGVRSATSGESWVELNAADESFGLVRDGNWHEVIIPLNAFLNCDFTTVSQLFMIAGDPPASDVEFSIDNIYWTPSVPRATPENGNFGIFTEDPTHATAGAFQIDVDGSFNVWEGTLVAGTQNPYEGTASMSFNSAPGFAWFGAAFTPTIKYNLSAFRFPDSRLHVALKTNSSTTFRLGMRSGNVDDIGQKWIEFAAGNDPYGFVRDGNWHVLEIPMTDFTDSVDLTAVSMPFQLLGVNGPISNIEFDDVCFLNGGTALSTNEGTPTADAGDNLFVLLPSNSVIIDGSNSQDDGVINDYSWQQVSGPNNANLNGTNTAVLTASDLVEGEYVFRLTVTDDELLTDSDDVTVTVTTGAPMADAGDDQTIELPAQDSVQLVGVGDDINGTIVSYAWSQLSGPAPAVLIDENMATATASNLQEGTYVFELVVTDDDLLTGSDQVQVVVTRPASNIALGKPTATSSATGNELLSNRGFEAGSGASANGWNFTAFPAGNATAEVARVATLPYEGSWAVQLSVTGAANGGPAALADQITPTGLIVPGNAYDFTLQGRRVGEIGVGVVVQLQLRWLNENNAIVGLTPYMDIAGSITESYSLFGIYDVTAPAIAVKGQVVMRLAGGAIDGSDATIVYDDVSLASASGAQVGDNAVDGSASTTWASAAGDPQWIEIDLADRYDINQVVIDWGDAYAQEYDIDVSEDGVQWTTVYSTLVGAGGTETIDLMATGDYLRLFAHLGGTPNGCAIGELEAYGFPSLPAGDMDQDRDVDLDDVPHFVDALLGSAPAISGILQSNADMDDNATRDGRDVLLFVEALLP